MRRTSKFTEHIHVFIRSYTKCHQRIHRISVFEYLLFNFTFFYISNSLPSWTDDQPTRLTDRRDGRTQRSLFSRCRWLGFNVDFRNSVFPRNLRSFSRQSWIFCSVTFHFRFRRVKKQQSERGWGRWRGGISSYLLRCGPHLIWGLLWQDCVI